MKIIKYLIFIYFINFYLIKIIKCNTEQLMLTGCEQFDDSGDYCIKLKKLNFYTVTSINEPLTKDILDYVENQLSINQDDNKLILTSEHQFNVYLNDDQLKLLNQKKKEFSLEIKLNLVKNLDQILTTPPSPNNNNNNNININNNNDQGIDFKADIEIDKISKLQILLDALNFGKSPSTSPPLQQQQQQQQQQHPNNLYRSESGLIDYSHYFNFVQLTEFMKKINYYYPNQTRLYSIGKSSLGRELWAMDLTSYVGPSSSIFKQNVKLIGNMHGDEVVGRQMLIYLIDHMLYKFQKRDKQMMEIFNSLIISIVPSMNPDGYELGQRENANHFDLNRNFPDKFVGASSELYRKIQPEVQSVIDWSRKRNFVMSANLHGGSLVANYPFDSTRGNSNGYGFGVPYATSDDVIFRNMALTYSLNHGKMYQSKEFLGGIVNGAKWYTLRGGMQDYNYDFTNGMEITLELSQEKIPKAIELPKYWNDNRNALIQFITIPLKMSIFGRVTNSKNQGLYATIQVSNFGKIVTTDPSNGYYSRLLDDGFYNVTVSSLGYKSISKTILLNPNSRENVDFILESIYH